MSDFYILIIVVLCAWTLLKIIADPKLAYEYPYFMGGMFAVFLIPQAIGLKLNPGLAPAAAVDATFLMLFLCLLSVVLGYYHAPSINIAKAFNQNLNLKKLLTVVLAYTFLGMLFLFLINTHPDRQQKGNWSGILTIYFMLYQVINVAFAIYVFLAVQTKKPVYIVMALLTALPILQLIIFYGRRESTALFCLTIAVALYYTKGIAPPRLLIIGGLVFAMLIIPLIGAYRNVAEEDPVKAIASLNVEKDFIKYYKDGKDMELTVAAQMIDATTFYGSYDFGADYWNEVIFRFFPGQLFGRDFKAAIMIGSRGQDRFYRNFYPLNGLTTTCVGDCFRHFGLLGCLFYFFLGGFFRELWKLSQTSNVLIKTFYIICMVQAILSVSHGSVNFLPGIIHMYVFLWIAAAFSKTA